MSGSESVSALLVNGVTKDDIIIVKRIFVRSVSCVSIIASPIFRIRGCNTAFIVAERPENHIMTAAAGSRSL